jgi:hypothetical protein
MVVNPFLSIANRGNKEVLANGDNSLNEKQTRQNSWQITNYHIVWYVSYSTLDTSRSIIMSLSDLKPRTYVPTTYYGTYHATYPLY